MIAQFGTFEFALADRYRFEEIIGRGGMGIVYRAADVRMKRPVAIKMLHPVLTSEVGVKRFESEILIVAKLEHPNVVSIYECGEIDGRLFYVMADLRGETLRARLTRESMIPVADAVWIADQVASGLQHAHDRGIVHRDVKPENIILTDGRAVLVDFGLARVINDAGSTRLTESGFVVGTPQYMSPEQAAASPHVDATTDQYALACVLFEMLTAEPPFLASTPAATAMRHVMDIPPSLSTRCAEASPKLAEVMARALRKDTKHRHATVREFTRAASVTLRVAQNATPFANAAPLSLFAMIKAKWLGIVRADAKS